MIRIEGLRMVYDNNAVALESLDLTLENSSFVALLGPSGCGKTTTLNCIAGLLEPTEGKVWFDNDDVTEQAPKYRNVGMVFQSYALYPNMNVLDNIAFPLKQKKIDKAKRHQKSREIAQKLQIEHLLDRRPTQLSGGQQQRVAMARALVKEPRILLLDEPMSNLDARLKIEIRDEIKRIQQELGIISVIVTHDQEEAMAIANKIAILDNGRIQQFDTPEVLYHNPANLFVANFMGNPPMNFIDADVDSESVHCKIYGNGFSLTVPGELKNTIKAGNCTKIKLGIRPHQMSVSRTALPESIPMKLQIVENLGKELILAGLVGENFVRATLPEEHMVESYREIKKAGGNVYLVPLHLNVFDKETGRNLKVESQNRESL